MKRKALLLTVLGCVLLWTVSAAAVPGEKDQTLKTGKKGEIALSQPTKIGDTTLQPDTYVVQHRVSGNDHFVRFIQMKKLQDLNVGAESAGWYTYTQQDNVGEVKCRVEPAGATIEVTTVTIKTEGGSPRITQVAIKGENVLHVF